MKIRIERDPLADAVAWAARILPQKSQLPVLAGLRLDAGADGGLRLSGFDYEVSAEAELDVTVAEAGSVLVPGRLGSHVAASRAFASAVLVRTSISVPFASKRGRESFRQTCYRGQQYI